MESKNHKRIDAPNYTQVPNNVFDYWMSRVSPAEYKVLSCMCRKIFGWHKTSDTISKNQLIAMTGLSKNAVSDAVKGLERHGLLIVHHHQNEYGHHPNSYSLNISKPEDLLYSDTPLPPNLPPTYPQKSGVGRSPNDLGGGSNGDQGVGQNMTPQKKCLTKETLNINSSPESKLSRDAGDSDIVFSFTDKKFLGIEESVLSGWKEAYPSVNVEVELLRMKEWILSNESKSKKKKKWRSFITQWLGKNNERQINLEAFRQRPTPRYPASPPSQTSRSRAMIDPKTGKPYCEDMEW